MSLKRWVIAGATIVTITAFAGSATALAELGQAAGWSGRMSWLLPINVDVLALVALAAWFTPGVARYGRNVTIGTVAVSVTMNACSHLVSTNHLPVTPLLIIGVSSVPVVSMALAMHLTVELVAPRSTEHETPTTNTVLDPVSETVPDPVSAGHADNDHETVAPVPLHAVPAPRSTQTVRPETVVGTVVETPDDLDDQIAALMEQSVSQRKMAERLGVSPATINRRIKTLKEATA